MAEAAVKEKSEPVVNASFNPIPWFMGLVAAFVLFLTTFTITNFNARLDRLEVKIDKLAERIK